VFDHVERRRVLEQPAGEDSAPLRLRAGGSALRHIDLDERAGFRRGFPRRGPLASGEAHDHVAHAARLAGLDLDILGEVVALVEQAERGDALFARGAEAGIRHRRRSFRSGEVSGNFGLLRRHRAGLFRTGAKREQQQGCRQQRPGAGPGPRHGQASGAQAS